VADSDLSYTFTCPSCAGNFSTPLEKIPPVQARFRCPHCKQPMDFPSREQARVYAKLQAAPVGVAAGPTAGSRSHPSPEETPSLSLDDTSGGPTAETRFRVDKTGFEADVFDRRSIRQLIRTAEILENDRIRIDEGELLPAGSVPYLKSMFLMRRESRVHPPTVCRSHTDKVAFFRCRDTGRPLCEDCAPEKKFGGTTIRVCSHCGGTSTDLVHA
jgi:predicted Zn finger-like uncharacterized protein